MAIIFSYPTLTNLKQEDLLLVSDVSERDKPTKNITVKQIVDLLPALVPGGGTVSSVELSGGSTGLTVAATNGNPIVTSGSFTLGGVLNTGFGGTGFSAYNAYEMLLADAGGSLGKLSPGTANQVLQMSGAAQPVPQWTDIVTGGTVTSINVLGGSTGLIFTGGPIDGAGDITTADTSRLKVAYGGTWDGATSGTWTEQLAINTLTDASNATSGQVLSIDSNGDAKFSSISTGVSSWSGGTTGLVSNGGDPATGAVVLGVASKLVSNNGGTGYSNTDLQGGDVLFKGPSVLSRLPIGTEGHVLTVNSSNEPSWSAVPGGIGGSGTNGRAARWTSSTNLADSAFFDEGSNIGLGVSPVANQHFTIDSSLYSTSIKILNKNSAVGHVGVNAYVGEFYTGAQDIVGIQGSSIGSSAGKRQGGKFISRTSSAGINIGITAEAANGGTGSHYAARFQDGYEAVDKYWRCVNADGDGQWSTIPDNNTNYDLSIDWNFGYAQLALLGTDGSNDTIKFQANTSAQVNNDLVVYADNSADSLTYAHKDIFADAGGLTGQYIGVDSITVTPSGHISNVQAQKFIGKRPIGIAVELAAFQGDSASEQIAMPLEINGSGKPGDMIVQMINNGTNSNLIKIAIYSGNVGDNFSLNNKLVTWGQTSVGTGNSQTGFAISVDSNYTATYTNGFTEGNYIFFMEIPNTMQLLSISQDGDLQNGGCKVSGVIFNNNSTPPTSTLGYGITKTARVAGTPVKFPVNGFVPS